MGILLGEKTLIFSLLPPFSRKPILEGNIFAFIGTIRSFKSRPTFWRTLLSSGKQEVTFSPLQKGWRNRRYAIYTFRHVPKSGLSVQSLKNRKMNRVYYNKSNFVCSQQTVHVHRLVWMSILTLNIRSDKFLCNAYMDVIAKSKKATKSICENLHWRWNPKDPLRYGWMKEGKSYMYLVLCSNYQWQPS